MTTLSATSSQADRHAIKAQHAGITSVFADYVLSASLSVGDVIDMVKVPNGARMEEILVEHTCSADVTLDCGDRGSEVRYIDSLSVAPNTVTMFKSALGHKYSAQSSTTEFAIRLGVAAGTSSAVGTLRMVARYSMEDRK